MTNEFSVELPDCQEAVARILIYHGVNREIVLGHFARILRSGVCTTQ